MQRVFLSLIGASIILLVLSCSDEPASPEVASRTDSAADIAAELACAPACGGRECGNDGCDGSCGNCYGFTGGLAPELCLEDGTCCVQQCTGRMCGDDGCGGICGDCNDGGQCQDGQCSYLPNWTVMVYLAIDNDLEACGLGDIFEMAEVGSNENLSIVVQVDWAPGNPGRPPVFDDKDYAGTQRLLIKQDEVEILEDLDEQVSASPDVLADFISWGIAKYPAEHYALILGNHGGGWAGFGWDFSSNYAFMSLSMLAQGIAEGLANAGGPTETLDLLGFDACLMASFEVALALAPYADWLLASEESEGGEGWQYRALQTARDDPTVTARELGEALANEYAEYSGGYGGNSELTISLVDLALLASVNDALSALIAALTTDLDAKVMDVMTARFQAEQLAWMPYDFMSCHLIDLGDFASILAETGDGAKTEAVALAAAISDAVVLNRTGPDRAHATGLSIYFPPYLLSKYLSFDESSDMVKQTFDYYGANSPPQNWYNFLSDWLASVAPEHLGPVFACPEDLPESFCFQHGAFFDETMDTVTIHRGLLEGTAAEDVSASVLFGFFNMAAWSLDVYGLLPGSVSMDTGLAQGTFDWKRLVLRQGDVESVAYWSAREDGPNRCLTIPFHYVKEGADKILFVRWELTIGAETGDTIASELLVDSAEGVPQTFEPAAGSKLFPLRRHLDLNLGSYDWAPLYYEFDPTDEIEFLFEEVPPCETYFLALHVEDELGRNDVAAVSGICRGDNGPFVAASINVEGAGKWEDELDDAPDFAVKLYVEGELVFESDVVQDGLIAQFEAQVAYHFYDDVILELWEVDGDDDTPVAEFEVGGPFWGANSNCAQEDEFTFPEERVPGEKSATVKIKVQKCGS